MSRNTTTNRLDVVEDALPLLRTEAFGRRMQGHREIDSTNKAAAAWAEAGAPEGSVVFAEYQTAGRGRLGRSWHATAGLNLMLSIVLRPHLPPDRRGLITLAACVAVAEALEPFTSPIPPQIKWPNDILLQGRKCCGMLLESTHTRQRPEAGAPVILGIGMNVNQASFDAPLESRATSVLLETGRPVHRPTLLAGLLNRLEERYVRLQSGDTASVRQAYLERLANLGEPVLYRSIKGRGMLQGRIEGVSDTGALLLRTETGVETLHAGEITTQPSAHSMLSEEQNPHEHGD